MNFLVAGHKNYHRRVTADSTAFTVKPGGKCSFSPPAQEELTADTADEAAEDYAREHIAYFLEELQETGDIIVLVSADGEAWEKFSVSVRYDLALTAASTD